ncbi:MAG: hypothetical protein EOR99_35030 [Mesorhizobium sp.]|nr:MAG: hypothetical protein EOR99_35030 [Mesorhizobium sp.]
MSTHSTDGREWAKLSALKPGDQVRTDGGFSCGMSNATLAVGRDDRGLFVPCHVGHHYLDGQLSDVDNDHLVGVWPA